MIIFMQTKIQINAKNVQRDVKNVQIKWRVILVLISKQQKMEFVIVHVKMDSFSMKIKFVKNVIKTAKNVLDFKIINA